MKKILTIAAAVTLAGAAYAISAAGDNPADATPKAGASCCAARKAAKAEGGVACCKMGAEAATKMAACQTGPGKEVTLTGKVLCEHCDLHTASACSPALKAEGREGYLKICSTSKDIPTLKQAGDVEVKGYIHAGPDGRDEIEIVSFNKKPVKT
jgi:hypothetical protein